MRWERLNMLTNCQCKGNSPGFRFVQKNLLCPIHAYLHNKTKVRQKKKSLLVIGFFIKVFVFWIFLIQVKKKYDHRGKKWQWWYIFTKPINLIQRCSIGKIFHTILCFNCVLQILLSLHQYTEYKCIYCIHTVCITQMCISILFSVFLSLSPSFCSSK